MSRPRINQIREPELAHVPQPLESWRVHEPHRESIDPDVVPKRVADDLEFHGSPGKGGHSIAAASKVARAATRSSASGRYSETDSAKGTAWTSRLTRASRNALFRIISIISNCVMT